MTTPAAGGLFKFVLYDSTSDEGQVLLGHATSNVMTDYLDRYMPYMLPGDRIIVEAVPSHAVDGHEVQS